MLRYRGSINEGYEILQANGFISINTIIDIHKIIEPNVGDIRKLPKIYSKELVDLIYYEFYTKNIYFQQQLKLSRATATKYLKSLVQEGFLIEEKIGKEVIYKNIALFELIEIY